MNIEQNSQVLRSHLLKMTMLSQRAVDYSIKAFELSSAEFCLQVRLTERELLKLQLRIGHRGRTLLAAGVPVDSDSLFASCALRIYSALHVTYIAAAEIAQNTLLILEGRRMTESLGTAEMGKFVNSLVRLCTVALFNEEIRHAKTVLKDHVGQQWFDLELHLSHNRLIMRRDPHARFELAIIKCLGQIAEQAYEIADVIAMWLEGKDCLAVVCVRAA